MARLSLRGMGVWLVIHYLVELGGREVEPGLVTGAGWQAQVWEGEPFRLRAIRLGVSEVEFSGEVEAVQQVQAAFEKKALRAGG